MQGVLLVAATHRPCVRVVTCVLAAAVSIVTRQCTVFLVFGQLKARSTLARHSAFAWSLSADVGTAMVLVHAVHSIIRAVDAGMLVVTEEEAIRALTFVAPHCVDTHLLASTVVVQTLVHIQTVVSIMGQHESIIAGAPVVAWYVDAFVDTASIVVILTFVHVLALLAISLVAWLADAVVGLGCVLAESVNVAVVRTLCALVGICESDIPHHPASIYEEDKQTNVPGKTSAPHADRRCEDSAGLFWGFGLDRVCVCGCV